MSATLLVGFNTIYRNDKTMLGGFYMTDFVRDLRRKFGGGGTIHRHDGTSGDGNKVLFSNLATVPTGLTGGTTHNKTAHQDVTDRTISLPLQAFRMASGTAFSNAVSITVAYLTAASGIQKIVIPAAKKFTITQSVLVPDNFNESANAQSIKVVARAPGATTTTLDGQVRIIKGGSLLGSDLNPTLATLTAGSTKPEKVTLALANITIAQEDLLAINLFPTTSTMGRIEIFGAWVQYTGEE